MFFANCDFVVLIKLIKRFSKLLGLGSVPC